MRLLEHFVLCIWDCVGQRDDYSLLLIRFACTSNYTIIVQLNYVSVQKYKLLKFVFAMLRLMMMWRFQFEFSDLHSSKI